MIVIILPWGAYARVYAAAPVEIGAVVQAGAKLSAPRTCRTAVLSGFGCALDPVATFDGGAPAVETLAAGWPCDLVWATAGWSDAPPKGPPRSV